MKFLVRHNIGMAMALYGKACKWHGMERFENDLEMAMACHGMTWKGMTMAWHGNDMASTSLWD
jgi:hypothetical protein